MVNGKLTNNPADVAEALNYYFVDSVVTISQCFSPKYSEVYTVKTVEQALTLRAVSELDVTRTITSLKPSRAKDIFGMDVIMFKELSESLVNPITKMINLSVSQGMFPCAWKSSVIVPIFKSGDPHFASNYRPISILPIVSKVAEKLMAAQITNYLNNSYFALHPMQFGFRANYSTEMANCYFTEKVKSLLDKGVVVGAVFLDLRKAFDTLNHRILLSKLLSFNFSPHTLRWIESYLSGRTQYVSIQNYNSAPLSISTGVPQGSILGPLLFTLYINDLPSVCPNTNIQMYADDTVIYIHGSSVSQVANELTESLVHVAAWLEQCCLQLNISKTVCMFITKTKNLSVVPDVFVSGERLQVVSEYKYLGVLIDSKLSFKAQVKKVCNRVRFSLSNFRFIRDYMSSDAALIYMHSMIISHITYCLTTWSHASITTLKPLESLYKQSLKTLDKKSVQFHHCSILKKYNLLSWDNLIKYVHICLLFKTMNSLISPLKQFVNIRTTAHRSTRGGERGDCIIPFKRSNFSQSVFSVKAAREWNSIPSTIRRLHTFGSFQSHLKKWLLTTQHCQH